MYDYNKGKTSTIINWIRNDRQENHTLYWANKLSKPATTLHIWIKCGFVFTSFPCLWTNNIYTCIFPFIIKLMNLSTYYKMITLLLFLSNMNYFIVILYIISPPDVIWYHIRCLDFIFYEPDNVCETISPFWSWNIFVILQILHKTPF